MKNKYLFISFFLFTLQINAQRGNGNEGQLKTLKIGYITQTLDLTSDDAQYFWPIYNEHQDKIHLLRRSNQRELMEQIKNSGGIDAISEKEAEEILDKFLAIENEIQEEKDKMYSELREVISAKKILKLHHAENEFNRKILQRLRKEKADSRKRP
ncbi:MAG: sensor of ECF-type sigma factor [Flavobacteriaceae bacterium]